MNLNLILSSEILSSENLNRGLKWWLKKWKKEDLYGMYGEIYETKRQLENREPCWWCATVERLSRWRALRGRNGITKEELKEGRRSEEYRKQIENRYFCLKGKVGREPTIADDIKWKDIEPLFSYANDIKNKPKNKHKNKQRKSNSPVFPSKLCHFLFPKLFIVVDNTATGLPPSNKYECFWLGMKAAWHNLDEECQRKLKETLMQAIARVELPPTSALRPATSIDQYPIETKIMELCLIGNNHPGGNP